MENSSVKYYLETNAIYSLINKIDIFADSTDVATSLLAYEELIDGIDEKNYHKRKILIMKLKASKLKIYPYLPMECIAISFGLDISGLPVVQKRKKFLWKKVNLVVSSDDYLTYVKALKETEGIEFLKEKESIDENEVITAKKLKKLIMQNSNEIEATKQRQKIEPEYHKIDIEKIFDTDKKTTYEFEKKILIQILDSCKISYGSSDIEDIIQNYDGHQLVAFILGQTAYTWNRSYHKKSSEYNDIPDLAHLLYLKDENYIIVSNDKIYKDITLPKMRVKPNDFLKKFEESH